MTRSLDQHILKMSGLHRLPLKCGLGQVEMPTSDWRAVGWLVMKAATVYVTHLQISH